jgi:hypothetical protein
LKCDGRTRSRSAGAPQYSSRRAGALARRAAKVIRRHTAGRIDEKAQAVLRAIADASSPRGVAAASVAFRRWAKGEGLLLVPPEDDASC